MPLESDEVAKRDKTDVLADHVRRAVAHDNSGRAGVEAVRKIRVFLVGAVDDAHPEAISWGFDTGKARTVDVDGGALDTAPATTRVTWLIPAQRRAGTAVA